MASQRDQPLLLIGQTVTVTTRNLNADMTQAVGRGMCCRWEPGYRPNDGMKSWERILDLAISDALEDAGFDQTVTYTQSGDTREMQLLGDDSPGEFIHSFQPIRHELNQEIDTEAMRLLMIELRDWILERGAMRQEMRLNRG